MVFHLEPNPATFNDPRWQVSSIREGLWLMAEGPDQARTKVALATLRFRPVVPGAPILRSPWYDDAFATCVIDTARTGVPEGVIIKSNGQILE